MTALSSSFPAMPFMHLQVSSVPVLPTVRSSCRPIFSKLDRTMQFEMLSFLYVSELHELSLVSQSATALVALSILRARVLVLVPAQPLVDFVSSLPTAITLVLRCGSFLMRTFPSRIGRPKSPPRSPGFTLRSVVSAYLMPHHSTESSWILNFYLPQCLRRYRGVRNSIVLMSSAAIVRTTMTKACFALSKIVPICASCDSHDAA